MGDGAPGEPLRYVAPRGGTTLREQRRETREARQRARAELDRAREQMLVAARDRVAGLAAPADADEWCALAMRLIPMVCGLQGGAAAVASLAIGIAQVRGLVVSRSMSISREVGEIAQLPREEVDRMILDEAERIRRSGEKPSGVGAVGAEDS